MYLYDEKQFWSSYRVKKGYIISLTGSRLSSAYDDMVLFMSDLLPLSFTEIASFGYRQFFTTLKKAQAIAKAREAQSNKLKGRAKR